MSISFQKWKNFVLNMPALNEEEEHAQAQSHLSVAELLKRPWRASVFFKKIEKNESFLLLNGEKVQVAKSESDKFARLEGFASQGQLTDNIIKNILGASSKGSVFIELADGKKIPLTMFRKTGEFGGKGATSYLHKENIAKNQLIGLINKELEKNGVQSINFIIRDKEGEDLLKIDGVVGVESQTSLGTGVAPKSDFIITTNTGDNIYISHKDGTTPQHFHQWSGVTLDSGQKIMNHPEVLAFSTALTNDRKITYERQDKNGNTYYEMIPKTPVIAEIFSSELKMMAIFGEEYTPVGQGTPNNVDIVCQGSFSITPHETLTNTYILSAYHMIARKGFKGDFSEGYMPVLTAKYNSGRSNLGIKYARISIHPRGGVTSPRLIELYKDEEETTKVS